MDKKRKIDNRRIFKHKHELLTNAFAAGIHPAEGATERDKVMYVPSRNTIVDCFDDRGAIFSASRDIYQKQSIELTTHDN
jgi:hypothetical protein